MEKKSEHQKSSEPGIVYILNSESINHALVKYNYLHVTDLKAVAAKFKLYTYYIF